MLHARLLEVLCIFVNLLRGLVPVMLLMADLPTSANICDVIVMTSNLTGSFVQLAMR